MDDGLTNASRAFAAQNGVGAKGDHDDGDADDVIVTVDPLRVKRVRQMDVTGSEDHVLYVPRHPLPLFPPRFSPLSPQHVLDPPEGERMLALLAQLDSARARAAQRKGARGGKGGRKRRDRGEADGDAGGDENEREKGRKGEGGGGEDLKGGGGKAAGAGGAGGKAVAEAHGEWAWQGVMSQLTSAQEELRVIVDLVNAVESGAEGLAVSGVSKPKQHAAEMSSELTARLAGKLTLLQVGTVRFSVVGRESVCFRSCLFRLLSLFPLLCSSHPFSPFSPSPHDCRHSSPSPRLPLCRAQQDVGGGLLHAAARLTQQVSDDAPFYTALQRIQHRWKVKRTHPALAPPPTPLSAASSTAAGFAADVTVQSLLLSLPHAPSLPASMPLIPATILPFTSLRLDRDKQGMLRAAPPEGQPIRRLHVSVFGREAGGDYGEDGGGGARSSSEGLVGNGGEEEGEGGRMAEGKEGEEGAEEEEEGGVGRAVRQAHELLRAAQRSWLDCQLFESLQSHLAAASTVALPLASISSSSLSLSLASSPACLSLHLLSSAPALPLWSSLIRRAHRRRPHQQQTKRAQQQGGQGQGQGQGDLQEGQQQEKVKGETDQEKEQQAEGWQDRAAFGRFLYEADSAAARVYLGEAYLLLQQQAQERARKLRFQLLDSEIEGEGEGEEEREGGDGGSGMRCGGGGERGEARLRAAGGLEWWGRSEGGVGGSAMGGPAGSGRKASGWGWAGGGGGGGGGGGTGTAAGGAAGVGGGGGGGSAVGMGVGVVELLWGAAAHRAKKKAVERCLFRMVGVLHAWYGAAGSMYHAWYGAACMVWC
ncbi:unnamed protein product [Closterium sp. Naga37s-1]|nr:unnamed protein product [Closterium sp. Naga37s-1]